MKALGIIPGRKGSQRLPDKHHVRLLGKPMFAYTIEAALRARQLDRVIVSSDDPELALMAASYGVEFIERPPHLAVDSAPLDDALRHACHVLEERDGFRPDLVIAMQGNVPIRKEDQIDDVITRLERLPDATAVCTAQPQRFRPEWAKVISDEATGECAPYMSADRGFLTQDYAPLYVMDGAVCGVRSDVLLNTAGQRASHAWFGPRPHLVTQDAQMYSLEVDYPDQIDLAEYYLRLLAERGVLSQGRQR
jgi:CMP-N,N'-diacetyllegionaminic acid synthase